METKNSTTFLIAFVLAAVVAGSSGCMFTMCKAGVAPCAPLEKCVKRDKKGKCTKTKVPFFSFN